MTELTWTNKYPVYETTDIRNDGMRRAFDAIARTVRPYLRADAYHSDLLWDADNAAKLNKDEHFYLLVRGYGTNYFASRDDAVAHCDPRLCDGRAVVKVTRCHYDVFRCEVVHETPVMQEA